MNRRLLELTGIAFLAFWALGAAAAAPDPTVPGPFDTATGSYRFPAQVMTDVLANRKTELWAEVYYPVDGPLPMPVVLFLHGNHATCGYGSNPRQDVNCQYTQRGTCPAGQVVVPNHLGYGYLATQLASWGHYVVSINANRGITCGSGVAGDSGLNLARGRLILKHLEQLSRWSTGQEPPPPTIGMDVVGALDFSRVGLAGHSRGGEGVRAAYVQYQDPGSLWPTAIREPVTFAAIFEIGAVDGQTSRVLDAEGVPWNQVLPMCDGDVSDLQGIKPYDRMMKDLDEPAPMPRSTYAVWGANHNFFNTERQVSDSPGGVGHAPLFPDTMGSPAQRTVGLAAATAFFRTHLDGGPDVEMLDNFDPLAGLTPVVAEITAVDRNFSLSPGAETSPPLEDFSGPTGRNMYGYRNLASGVTVSHDAVPGHDGGLRGGRLTWTEGGPRTLFQTNWTAAGLGRDLRGYDTLDIQVSRSTSALNPEPQTPTDFSLALVGADGTRSVALRLSSYAALLGPVGSPYMLHQILQTVRIPLADFTGVPLDNVRSLRVTFDQTAQGEVFLAGIRASRFSDAGAAVAGRPGPGLVQATAAAGGGEAAAAPVRRSGRVERITAVAEPAALPPGHAGVEVELALDSGTFPVRDALAVLEIGSRRFTLSRHPEDGDTSRIVFTIPAGELAGLRRGAAVRVYYGSAEHGVSNWEAHFGAL